MNPITVRSPVVRAFINYGHTFVIVMSATAKILPQLLPQDAWVYTWIPAGPLSPNRPTVFSLLSITLPEARQSAAVLDENQF